MAALLILNMTTCYFGILARSHSRGVRSIVATRLLIRLTILNASEICRQ
jgi:hypothetical protein